MHVCCAQCLPSIYNFTAGQRRLTRMLAPVHLLTKQRLKFDLELCERILRHHKVGMAVSVLNGSKAGAGPSLGPQLLLLLESGAD